MRTTWLAFLLVSCAAHATPGSHATSLAVARASHSASLLADGTVLIAGGFDKAADGHTQIYTATTEIYDPVRHEFRMGPRMLHARCGHSATTLLDGNILFAGGFAERGMLASAELYVPERREFVALPDMTVARGDATGTLLGDGRVLIVGGGDGEGIAVAELYDPKTRSFARTGSLAEGRMAHTATRLQDGRVLVVGGSSRRGVVLAGAEIYDASTGAFRAAGDLVTARYKHAATLLADGRVLITGGSDAHDWTGQLDRAEVYDPAGAGGFRAMATTKHARFKLPQSTVRLGDGRVLIAGGAPWLELFDPASGKFEDAGQVPVSFYYGTATAVGHGGVLVVGGYDQTYRASARAVEVAL